MSSYTLCRDLERNVRNIECMNVKGEEGPVLHTGLGYGLWCIRFGVMPESF